MPQKSERGISREPEPTIQEGKLIQQLTKDDIIQIAETTGGRFNDFGVMHGHDLIEGTIFYGIGHSGSTYLTLLKQPNYDNSSRVIHIRGNVIMCDFGSEARVTLNEGSVTIEDPKNSSPVRSLTIGQRKIVFETPFEQGKIVFETPSEPINPK